MNGHGPTYPIPPEFRGCRHVVVSLNGTPTYGEIHALPHSPQPSNRPGKCRAKLNEKIEATQLMLQPAYLQVRFPQRCLQNCPTFHPFNHDLGTPGSFRPGEFLRWIGLSAYNPHAAKCKHSLHLTFTFN